ncbi:uncharacterized protein LOC127264013 [Andrographis paniculata]|uniref:uncharacterized protein LOC127264013 n=1 Tax=Andrographis paniculata TaxID=175694 RepID=UPI0021E84A75|nr:uncharacterized protein LOC127264013 [Andrographis paniculata]
MSKEGRSTSRPPLFDGTSYRSWKNKMEAFLMLQGEDVSEAVESAWSHPMKTIQNEDNTVTLVKKPKREWTLNEKAAAIANSKALFSIFNAVDETQAKLISNCKVAKEAWDILENAFEGSVQVRESKLDHVETLFEALKINEDETIAVYHNRFMDVVNQAEALGMHFEEKRLVRKMLKSLTKNFRPKVIMLDEPPKLRHMTLDELYGTLVSYEMNYLEDEAPKSVALSAEDLEMIESDEEMALLSRKLSRMISEKRAAKLKFGKFQNRNSYQGGGTSSSQRKYPEQKPTAYSKPKDRFDGGFKKKFVVSAKPETVQEPTCYGCGGVGHIKSECPTVKKREKRAYQATWSDNEDGESAGGDEQTENHEVVAFMADDDDSSDEKTESSSKTTDESRELDTDELIEAYEEMVAEQKKAVVKNKELLDTIYRLEAQKEKLEDELEKLTKIIEDKFTESKELQSDNLKLKNENDRLRKRKEKLDEVLSIGKPFGDHKGLGFCESSQSRPTTFVRGGLLTDVKLPEKKSTQVWKQNSRKKRSRIRNKNHRETQSEKTKLSQPTDCKYCMYPGHSAVKCLKLAKDVISGRRIQWPTEELKQNIKVKFVWIPKETQKQLECNVILSSQESTRADRWYFDSGCSRHMTNQKGILKNFVEDRSGEVIFGDGAKGKISGYGILEKEGIPRLSKVYFVEGLSTNLISISQLCDDDLHVKFTKDSCEVYDTAQKCVMTGIRSKNNCYLLEYPQMEALILKDDESMLWHTRLGHVNPQNLLRISKIGAVRGLPKFSKIPNTTCGDCARGKQKRAVHSSLEQRFSSNCLELLHMDLMGPVDVCSLGGKKYILVCVDDFSRYTWVDFLREKSDAFDVFEKLGTRLMNEKKSKINRLRTDH